MIFKYLYDSIIGLIVGNWYALIFRRKHESPIWISSYYYKHGDQNTIQFLLIWLLLTWGVSAVLLLYGHLSGKDIYSAEFSNVISIFFFVLGAYLGLNSLHYFDKLYIYPDRIEVRLFLFSYLKIDKKDIRLILRDQESKNFAHIIYNHPVYGLTEMGGKKDFWRIPSKVFSNAEVEISSAKLHPNLFQAFENVRDSLPPNSLQIKKLKWKQVSLIQKFSAVGLLLFNPFSVLLFISVIFGIFIIHPVMIFLFDVSRRITGYFYKNVVQVEYINPML